MSPDNKTLRVEEIKRQLAITLNHHRLSVESGDAALRLAMSHFKNPAPSSR